MRMLDSKIGKIGIKKTTSHSSTLLRPGPATGTQNLVGERSAISRAREEQNISLKPSEGITPKNKLPAVKGG